MVRRVYVEKKPEFAVQAHDLLHEAKHYLHIEGVEEVRVFIRYDVEDITDETLELRGSDSVLPAPPVRQNAPAAAA